MLTAHPPRRPPDGLAGATQGVPFMTFGRPWGAPERTPGSTSTAPPAPPPRPSICSTDGHRRIAFLGWPAGSGVGDDRRAGWATTMTRGRPATRTGWHRHVRWTASPRASGRARAAHDRPTRRPRVVCASDPLALGALRPSGRRPRRPAVIGFDDTPMAQAAGLSSVRQPLAEAAADMLCRAARTGVARPGAHPRPEPAGACSSPTLVLRLRSALTSPYVPPPGGSTDDTSIASPAAVAGLAAVAPVRPPPRAAAASTTPNRHAKKQRTSEPADPDRLVRRRGDQGRQGRRRRVGVSSPATQVTVTPAQDIAQQLGQAFAGGTPPDVFYVDAAGSPTTPASARSSRTATRSPTRTTSTVAAQRVHVQGQALLRPEGLLDPRPGDQHRPVGQGRT